VQTLAGGAVGLIVPPAFTTDTDTDTSVLIASVTNLSNNTVVSAVVENTIGNATDFYPSAALTAMELARWFN
jgi:predicted neuraminidase